MTTVTLGGNPVTVAGKFPSVGENAPDFSLSTTEGLNNVVTLSTFRGQAFHKNYGVDMTDSVLRGLTARAVVVLDEQNKVLHSELVTEIKEEPNYDAALKVLA